LGRAVIARGNDETGQREVSDRASLRQPCAIGGGPLHRGIESSADAPAGLREGNLALVSLAQALADSPHTILQKLADTIFEILQVGSAGISLLTKDKERFYWPAIAGLWRPHRGGGTPRDFGPCGDVLDLNSPLLFRRFERRYSYFLPVTPAVEECLLVPFYVEGKAVGTIWAIAHDDRRKFDAEDRRQLLSMGKFASSAYQAVAFLDEAKQQDETLRKSNDELAHTLAELRKANEQAQGSRRAALNVMEDAIQSREAMERLNAELRESEEEREKLLASEQAALAKAETANRVKDEFLAIVSHELRTPLNAIVGWSEILRRGALDQKGAIGAAETIMRNAKMQNQLISDLLDVSRIISGKLRLEAGAVELIPVIEAAMDTMRPAARAKGIEFHVLADDRSAVVSGDAGRLQRFSGISCRTPSSTRLKGGESRCVLNAKVEMLRLSSRTTARGSDQSSCLTSSTASVRPTAQRRGGTVVSGWDCQSCGI
jgi:signal transduction histidine kinase